MFNRNWFDSFDMNQGQGMQQNQGQGMWGQGMQQNQGMWQDWQGWQGGATELPTRTSPTQYAQPQVSPTRQFVQRNVANTVVPHYHPSHLTTVNQNYINNQHYFPHTESVVNECFETNTMCGSPWNPSGHARGCNCSKKRKGW